MYKNYFKRLFDFLLAFAGLIILSPVFILLILLLFFPNQGAGVFFTQKRPGKNEKIFKVIKFKTMSDERDSKGNLLPDAQRLTKIGKFMRNTSLDEIPQLINVLKGDMSLIGPRPLLVQYLPYYKALEKLRHSVRPGITGLAQVNGRNTLNWDERLEMDVKYVENLSFRLDIDIFFKTIKNVILRKDIIIIPGERFTTLDKYRKNNHND